MRSVLLCTLPLLVSAGSTCLGSNPDGSNICFSWAVDPAGATVTINAQCTPPSSGPGVGPVSWCSLGLAKAPNTANKMFPADVMVFGGVLPGAAAGSAFVGDHYAVAYSQPPCLPVQSSRALGSYIAPGSNALNVTFTRACFPLLCPFLLRHCSLPAPARARPASRSQNAFFTRDTPLFPVTGPLVVPPPGVSIASGVPIGIIGALSTQALPGNQPFCATKPPGVFPTHVEAWATGATVTFF